MYKIAVYPGSFDPITNGHIDIINRASRMFEKLIVAILVNTQKESLFTVEERKTLLAESLKGSQNIEVDAFSGLLVDYCNMKNIPCIVRGLRAISDFENEIQIANINKSLNGGIETVFLSTDTKFSYISSSAIKEIACFNGDVSRYVPEPVVKELVNKFKE